MPMKQTTSSKEEVALGCEVLTDSCEIKETAGMAVSDVYRVDDDESC